MEEKPITWFLTNTHGVDDRGAEAIWNEFFPRLRRMIELRLQSTTTRSFDSDDIVQNAMHSLFNGLQSDRFTEVSNRDDLWRLLVTIAARKITAQRRKSSAQKRGGNAVRGESVFSCDAGDSNDISFGINQVMDKNRMPESADEVLRTYEEMLPRIRDPQIVRTVMLRMEGYSNTEIAAKLQCSVSRVEQRIAKVRRLWQNESDGTAVTSD